MQDNNENASTEHKDTSQNDIKPGICSKTLQKILKWFIWDDDDISDDEIRNRYPAEYKTKEWDTEEKYIIQRIKTELSFDNTKLAYSVCAFTLVLSVAALLVSIISSFNKCRYLILSVIEIIVLSLFVAAVFRIFKILKKEYINHRNKRRTYYINKIALEEYARSNNKPLHITITQNKSAGNPKQDKPQKTVPCKKILPLHLVLPYIQKHKKAIRF